MFRVFILLSILAFTAILSSCGVKTISIDGTKTVKTSSSSSASTPTLTLTDPGSRQFPSNYMNQGTLYTFDFNNADTGNDLNMTYTCAYSYSINGSAAIDNGLGTLTGGTNSTGGWPCSDITTNEGGFAFNAATGVITWTPVLGSSWGGYTITVTGTNSVSGLSGSRTIALDIRRGYASAGLVRYYSAEFGSILGGEGSNSPFNTSIPDLTSTLGSVVGNLINFAGTTSSGWAGVVTQTSGDSYRIKLDGVDDYMDMGTQVNGNTTMSYDGLISLDVLSNVTSGGKTIMGNGDSSGKGLSILTSSIWPGQIEAVLGERSYYDEVMRDNPVGYWHLGETAIGGASDAKGANNGAYNGVTGNYTWSQANGFSSAEKTVRFTGTSSRVNVPHNATLNPTGSTFTIEFWLKFNTAFPAALKDIIQKGDYGASTYYGIRADNTQMGFLYYDTTFHYNKNVTYATLGMVAGTWYHVAYVVDNPSNTAYIYVNGVQKATDTPVGDARAANANTLYIGGSAINGHPDINISDVAIFNTAVSATRLAAHVTASTRPTCLSSVAVGTANAYFHMGAYWDNASTTLGIYLSGVSRCSYNAGAHTITGSTANFRIGTDSTASTFWAGAWLDTRVYNSGVTAAIVTNNGAN